MMRATLFFIGVMLLCALPARAQQAEGVEEEPPVVDLVYITFTIEGRLDATLQGARLPLPILQRMMQAQPLASLEVNEEFSSARNFLFKAQFVFESIEDFDEWYASNETRVLLNDLRTRNQGVIEVALTMKRLPQARLLVLDNI
ncbi:MAG: hypothetical protein ACE5G0_23030 [Rhodothermales bacterium]